MTRSLRPLAAIALGALIGAGCSNAPAETGSGGGGGGNGGGNENAAAEGSPNPELKEKLPEYAKCMRENGVEDFLDPGADGTIQYYGDTDPSEFKSASEKCDDLLPPDRGRNW
jgi:hypothetical protein